MWALQQPQKPYDQQDNLDNMSEKSSLFTEFSPTSMEQWLARLQQDLKGRPVEELDWQLEESIRVAPFYTAAAATESLTAGRTNNSWRIGEYIKVQDMAQANAIALEGLAGGVNAPVFQLHHLPTLDELEVLLKDIEPAFITAHFAPHHPGKDPAELFRNLIYYVRRRGLQLSSIAGSVDFDPLLDWTDPPFRPLARILRFATRHTPAFKMIQVNGSTFHTGPDATSRELSLIIAKGATYLAKMAELDIPTELTNAHMQFSVAVSTSYFVEIAKIRALRILWANVLAGYGLAEATLPPIVAHLSRESQTEDSHTNMIRAGTQAMAAAIGGANTIIIRPANHSQAEESTTFSRRIARNLQHLLQMESRLDRVVDPAAGSFYIEQLTQSLCEQAWAQFQAIEKQGGFLAL